MTTSTVNPTTGLVEEVIKAFDDLNGPQPGFRPAHAKGILLSGTFTPSPSVSLITRAPHLQRASTPVTVRFSDFAGVPSIPDNDPNASPRGIAIRFHLAEHVHTDIIAHSVDGFPARTAEEFAELLQAIYASPAGAPKPTPIESFLAAHPAALRFVQVPKPIPASFATECYYAVNAYRFLDSSGVGRYGRYVVRPDEGGEYLDAAAAARKPANFLFDEIKQRLAKGVTKLHVLAQLAEDGDVVNDSTVQWPKQRPEAGFGTIELESVIPDNDAAQRHIIFDPIPRVDGIEPSDDPLLESRAAVYLATGRRRRAGGPK
jgi:catalase